MFIDDMKKSILQKAMNGELINGSDYNSREEKKMEDCCTKIETGNSISENIKKTKYTNLNSGYNFIATKDLEFDHSFQYENGVKIPYDEPNFKYADNNDILLCIEGGSAGRKIGILSQKVCYGNKLCKFSTKDFINPRYLYYFLQSPEFQKLFRENINGLIGGVSIGKVKKFILKYPPLEEQNSIVIKLDELLPLLDEARPLEEEITELEKEFPDKLRKAILQYAIQGKLVEQNPSDEPASELLKKIKEEKNILIGEGKIKKEKPLELVTDEEKFFEIPDNWEWIRLGEIGTILGGKRIPAGRSLSKEDTGYKYIRVSDMKDYSVSLDNIQFVPKDIYPSISRYIINKEDVYITVAGTIGRVGKVPPELDGANLTENADRIVINNINQDWLIYCLSSDLVQSQISSATTQVGQPKLAIKRIQDLLFPLPPLEEQKRMVAKLDELLKLCDELEEQIG